MTDFNSNRHFYLSCSGFEIYGALKDTEDPNAAARAAMDTLEFIPSYDFDTNGIIYWLGTNRGTSPWKNPGIRGSVRVVSSSLAKDSHPQYAAIGRETVRCVTEPKKSSWFMFDLLQIKVIPTHYTVRHYASFDTECLRNWRLEACNNSQTGADGNWITLMKHVNDTSLNHKGASFTWQIPAQNVAGQAFSQYRLFQFGVNSNQHHYLSISGFDIYGTIVSGHKAQYGAGAQVGGAQAGVAVEQPTGATRKFEHRQDFDTNGLFYFLGCQGGIRSSYTNPADIGMVTVTSSSLMSDSQPLSALVGRISTRCVTKPHQKSWMQINLKEVKIKLTHYTLRHYNSWDTEALRYWNLEGSNDGQSWVPIRQHMDDRALRKSGGSHTWAVDTNHYFSNLRLFMTGRNSNNHWYLACSGVELYGTAFGGIVSERPTGALPQADHVQQHMQGMMGGMPNMAAMNMGGMPMPMPMNPMMPPNMMMPMNAMPPMPPPPNAAARGGDTFAYSRDFDGNGLIEFLATKCNTQQWQNPAQLGVLSIRTSGLMHDSAPLHCVVGKQAVRMVTKPNKHAWVVIDLHDYAIRPTHYTLRHYASWDTEALRNWRFEGSLDGENWKSLREHNNDQSLRFKGQSYTWTLHNVTASYSMFRIFQFDKNSNNHYYLALSGFEIYGDVVRQHQQVMWDEWPRNKSKKLQVDRARNSVFNTGSDDTWQTVKARPALPFDPLTGDAEFSVICERSEPTSNQWKFMVGVTPEEFTCNGSRQWLGSQKSYAYIGGTGGKCFHEPKSLTYGAKWGNLGDVVTVKANAKRRTIEYILNGVSQGVAFNTFAPTGNIYCGASITATGSRLRLMEHVTPRSKPPNMSAPNQALLAAAQQQQQQQAPIFGQPQMPIPPPRGAVPMDGLAAGAAPQAFNFQQMQSDLPNMDMFQVPSSPSTIAYAWDSNLKSQHLAVFPDQVTVTNKGSNDTWQGIVSAMTFSSGRHSFEIHIVNDTKTSNQWKYIVGLVPVNFDPKRTAWLGSQHSWGYIAGTGGKCHISGKSIAYGKRYGGQDRIKVVIDFNTRTIEFHRNDKSQGIAFNNLNGAVRPAVSITGKGSAVRICNIT